MLMKCPEEDTREYLSISSYFLSVSFAHRVLTLHCRHCMYMKAELIPVSSQKSSGEGDTKGKEEVHANLILGVDFGIGVWEWNI